MTIVDMQQRHRAVREIGSSFIVEAGAGSGKTSVLAARVICMLASGIDPKNIAAITFTEAAASELLGRVRKGIEFCLAWEAPQEIGVELKTAFTDVITDEQKANLQRAQHAIGSLTISTIHGFCQKLIKPYPVEANIDPGATIIAGQDADLAFDDVFEKWLREELTEEKGRDSLIAAMIMHDPGRALPAIRSVANALRDPAEITVSEAIFDETVTKPYLDAAKAFLDWNDNLPFWAQVDGQHVDIVAATRSIHAAVAAFKFDVPHVAVMNMVALGLHNAIYTAAGGDVKKYRCKGKWAKAAPKGMGDTLFQEAEVHYDRFATAYLTLREVAASYAVQELRKAVLPLIEQYQTFKRESAALDFDDLLRSALALLQNYPQVRRSLSDRYRHILVDEYQDTDRIQTEILMLLTFENVDGISKPRPGSLFLVGDPKQAIYRFRGADVGTYTMMRARLQEADPDAVLKINVNFRSQAPILEYVNQVFEEKFAANPGFERLEPFHNSGSELNIPAVTWFDVDTKLPKPNVSDWRKAEATAIADLCKTLIGNYPIRQKDGKYHNCRPGDIAFLVPQGTELYHYENALEEAGIPIASQAGKGMYRQQEIQDMIALTRTIADERDTLALGAFLRGPLIGLTEQEMLDETHLLGERANGSLNFLTVGMDTSVLTNEVLIDSLNKLAKLRSEALNKSPHDILSEAVDLFMIRPKVRARFKSSPERRLANIDRFLEMSTSYSVRGFRAFSDAMRAAWEDAERTSEGRPDGQEDAISFITMHSAKGLEWPVVFPINTMTSFLRPPPLIKNSAAGTVSMPFFDMKPSDYGLAAAHNDMENRMERFRLWYVAMTRAQNLLILPRIENLETRGEAWAQLLDIDTEAVPKIDVAHLTPVDWSVKKTSVNLEDRATFDLNNERLEEAQTSLIDFVTPSKHEGTMALTSKLSIDELMDAVPDLDPYAGIKGSKERGVILHKLMEEVLTGETSDTQPELKTRAKELIDQIVARELRDLEDLSAYELARCVVTTLNIPVVKELRPRLIPELGTSSRRMVEGRTKIMYGIMDAAEVLPPGADGNAYVASVIDWKSDVNPSKKAINDYIDQVRKYLDAKGIGRGLIVFMTTGRVIELTMNDYQWLEAA
jgi:exodeoxyribonuclease-5